MKKLLTKTLFILLLSSVVIPSVIQANFSTADAKRLAKKILVVEKTQLALFVEALLVGGLLVGGLLVGGLFVVILEGESLELRARRQAIPDVELGVIALVGIAGGLVGARKLVLIGVREVEKRTKAREKLLDLKNRSR